MELLEKAFAATGADLQVTYDGRVRFVRPWELRRGDLMKRSRFQANGSV